MREKANRRISNVEPQNVEGWYRCALSFLSNGQYGSNFKLVIPPFTGKGGFYKIDRIPSFDIRYSSVLRFYGSLFP